MISAWPPLVPPWIMCPACKSPPRPRSI
jgi:hypothetical protein